MQLEEKRIPYKVLPWLDAGLLQAISRVGPGLRVHCPMIICLHEHTCRLT